MGNSGIKDLHKAIRAGQVLDIVYKYLSLARYLTCLLARYLGHLL